MTRVSRQWLPGTPSLDDIRAGILEVNPLAHTQAKPDQQADCTLPAQRVTPKGGTSHWRLRNKWFSQLRNVARPTRLDNSPNFFLAHIPRNRDGAITRVETPPLAPGQGRLEEGPGQR